MTPDEHRHYAFQQKKRIFSELIEYHLELSDLYFEYQYAMYYLLLFRYKGKLIDFYFEPEHLTEQYLFDLQIQGIKDELDRCNNYKDFD